MVTYNYGAIDWSEKMNFFKKAKEKKKIDKTTRICTFALHVNSHSKGPTKPENINLYYSLFNF